MERSLQQQIYSYILPAASTGGATKQEKYFIKYFNKKKMGESLLRELINNRYLI